MLTDRRHPGQLGGGLAKAIGSVLERTHSYYYYYYMIYIAPISRIESEALASL